MKLALLLLPLVAALPAAEPAKPATPADPAQPGQPGQPATPATPATPASPHGQSDAIPSAGTYRGKVQRHFHALSTDYTRAFLETFTGFQTRAAYSEHGVASQHFLMDQIAEVRVPLGFPSPSSPSASSSPSLR